LLNGSTRKGTGLSTPVAVFAREAAGLAGVGKCTRGHCGHWFCGPLWFRGNYGRGSQYVRAEHMTGRERRDGPPLTVFVYVVICIVFVVL
jgi:hypothetical protein